MTEMQPTKCDAASMRSLLVAKVEGRRVTQKPTSGSPDAGLAGAAGTGRATGRGGGGRQAERRGATATAGGATNGALETAGAVTSCLGGASSSDSVLTNGATVSCAVGAGSGVAAPETVSSEGFEPSWPAAAAEAVLVSRLELRDVTKTPAATAAVVTNRAAASVAERRLAGC